MRKLGFENNNLDNHKSTASENHNLGVHKARAKISSFEQNFHIPEDGFITENIIKDIQIENRKKKMTEREAYCK